MIAAAIDVGTNSTRLLIADILEGKIKALYRTMEITRLGENIGKTELISQVSAARTVEVLRDFKQNLNQFGVQNYRAVGTKALRVARNSKWFLDQVASQASIDIEIITGQQEAFLSYRGATTGLDLSKTFKNKHAGSKDFLVIDIGGGSTELILGNGGSPRQYVSLDIGCVSLREQFLDKNLGMEKYVHEFIAQNLSSWERKKFKVIGLAGTITTLAAIDMKLDSYDRDKIHHHMLGYNRIKEIYSDLKAMDLYKRKQVRGLDPRRADIIVPGAFILIEIMDFLGLDLLVVSEADILDGIIYSIVDF